MIKRKNIENELSDILGEMDKSIDVTGKEYASMVNNAAKLHQVYVNDIDVAERRKRNKFDADIRREQLKFEKGKFTAEITQKIKDRKLKEKEIEYQHNEKMREIDVAKIKAENENLMLKQNIMKMRNEYKINMLQTILINTVKFTGAAVTIGLSFAGLMNQLHFERVENGLVPARCGKYDNAINKAGEVFMK